MLFPGAAATGGSSLITVGGVAGEEAVSEVFGVGLEEIKPSSGRGHSVVSSPPLGGTGR